MSIHLIRGIGYPNLFLQPGWLYFLINELFDSEGQTFVDVGANIGQTLIAAKSCDRKIQYIGFEPNSSCCYYLKVLIETNRFEDSHVYNFALSDQLKESFLETNCEADPTASLVHNLRPSFFRNRESLFSIAYDMLALPEDVTCIKIDIEGGELEALLGMRELIGKCRPYIICEILDSFSGDVLAFTQARARQVCDILRENEYGILQLVQNEETTRIVSFNEMEDIAIVQWTQESLKLNDYVFFPHEKKDSIKDILVRLCKS